MEASSKQGSKKKSAAAAAAAAAVPVPKPRLFPDTFDFSKIGFRPTIKCKAPEASDEAAPAGAPPTEPSFIFTSADHVATGGGQFMIPSYAGASITTITQTLCSAASRAKHFRDIYLGSILVFTQPVFADTGFTPAMMSFLRQDVLGAELQGAACNGDGLLLGDGEQTEADVLQQRGAPGWVVTVLDQGKAAKTRQLELLNNVFGLEISSEENINFKNTRIRVFGALTLSPVMLVVPRDQLPTAEKELRALRAADFDTFKDNYLPSEGAFKDLMTMGGKIPWGDEVVQRAWDQLNDQTWTPTKHEDWANNPTKWVNYT